MTQRRNAFKYVNDFNSIFFKVVQTTLPIEYKQAISY